ncbi:MAG: glycine/sarcosine/betaine reductase selenoprotein B family protein [Chloroflexota bacterium]
MDNETFSEFKNSFSYGTRTDLSFKFLKGFSDEEAADFFQELLVKVIDSVDDGDINRLTDFVVDAQVAGYSKSNYSAYEDGPFTPLKKPVNEMRIGLLTSTGHFVEGDDPEPFGVKGMTQLEATARIMDFLKHAPELSEVPLETPNEQLCVRHGGYDIRGVQADRNVALPIDRMRELDVEGMVGTAVSPAYSFVGAAAQRRLQSQSLPGWIETFKSQNIEGAVLVPV